MFRDRDEVAQCEQLTAHGESNRVRLTTTQALGLLRLMSPRPIWAVQVGFPGYSLSSLTWKNSGATLVIPADTVPVAHLDPVADLTNVVL